MNGLLDFIKTPEGQGLLTAAFGGLAGARRGAPLNSIGRAGLAGLTGYSNAIEAQNQQAQQAQMDELRKMQVEQYKAATEKSRAELAEKARVDALLRGAVMPTTGADAIAQPGRVGPTPEKTGAIGQVPALDYQALLAQGVPFARVEELAKSRDLGRPQVKNIETVSIGGKPMRVGIDQYGQQVAQIGMQWTPLERVDAGGFVGLYDPTDPAKGVQKLTDKTMTPGEIASNQIARGQLGVAQGNLGVARERLNFERSGGSEKPPAGYRWTKDRSGLEPIPGGPAADKAQNLTEGERKAATLLKRLEGSLAQMQDVLTDAPGAAKPGVVSSIVRMATPGNAPANLITGSNRQRVEAAQLDILDAALTLGTGAAYTKEQLQGYSQSYFPQIGDDVATIKDKQDRLNTVLEAARIAAGRAATPQSPRSPAGQGQRPPADIQNLLNTYGGR